MKLRSTDREYAHLTFRSGFPVGGDVEISIDDGETWLPTEVSGATQRRFLVRGPDCDAAPVAGEITLTGSVQVLARLTDSPEIVTRGPSPIEIV